MLDLGKGVEMKLASIPAGFLLMGSFFRDECDEAPVHEVNFSKPFKMGVTPVTQEQYKSVMVGNPSLVRDEQYPVGCVRWYDAVKFCKKLSEKTGQVVRLPSEAEWEYACRAGSGTEYCFGDDETQLIDYGWYSKNSKYRMHPVGKLKPNAWGLYDMHGNVQEWCFDYYNDTYDEAPRDGSAWTTGATDAWVLRGGSYLCPAGFCRSACRDYFTKKYSSCAHYGFRVVVDSD